MLAEVSLRFDGRVAIVTGAGAGLGRAYALLFGSRGASVVVNDLGGSRSGDGNSSKVADQVVDEIRANGGKAVADYNSVTDGEKIVKTALDNFGRVDIVVNNAGILRDKSFARISDNDWNLVHDVHLKGAFKVTQAAWPHLRKQKYGRVIFTSSNSGIYGNFGQANYSAAKMGLVGLCNTLAIEGKSSNINCNVIVPTAASRLTEDVLPPDLFKELKPELIAPVVVWLCHENCQETDAIIESAAGWASKYAIIRGQGSVFRRSISDSATPESVRDVWSKITDTQTKFERLSSIEEATGSLFGHIEALKSGSGESDASEFEDEFTFNNKDCILYSLGIGISVQNPDNLRYLYENHSEFGMFPTQAIIPGQVSAMSSPLITSAIPGKSFDLSQVLHGEQYLEVYEPLPTSGTWKNVCRVVDVLDKGRNAVVVTGIDTYGEDGRKLCYSELTAFIVNGGGFGGKRSSSKMVETVNPPNRSADAIVETKTSLDQAALYRLSGDSNPLHIDPDFAAIGGFNRPILHGLCTLGVSVRCVLQRYANSKSELFKAVKARFAKPVYPGESLRITMWREGNRIHFETTSVESNQKVISGAYVDLLNVENGQNLQGLSLVPLSAQELKSDEVFNMMIERLKAQPELAKKVNGVFFFKITSGGQEAARWTADLVKGKIYRGDPESGIKVDTTLIMDNSVLVDMSTGKLSPQAAFMKGKLKIQGNIMLSQKLKDLLAAETNPSAPSPKVDSDAAKSPPSTPKLKSDEVFNTMIERLKAKPELVKKINGVFLYKITSGGQEVARWTTDLISGKIYRGDAEKGVKVNTTLTVDDADFIDMATGKLSPQAAFMKGKLKITGNIMLSQKLKDLLAAESKL